MVAQSVHVVQRPERSHGRVRLVATAADVQARVFRLAFVLWSLHRQTSREKNHKVGTGRTNQVSDYVRKSVRRFTSMWSKEDVAVDGGVV